MKQTASAEIVAPNSLMRFAYAACQQARKGRQQCEGNVRGGEVGLSPFRFSF